MKKIVHFCQFKLKHSNGVQAAAWILACEQAKAGEVVEIFSLGRTPKSEEVAFARERGIHLSGVSGGWKSKGQLKEVLQKLELDCHSLVHFHSVFILAHARFASLLREEGIRYVISPHGNLGPTELSRKKLKKKIYFRLFLERKLRESAMVVCVSKEEVRVVEKLVPGVVAKNLGNGVDPSNLVDIERKVSRGPIKGLSLAKSDVEHKGYDRMFSLSDVFEGGVDFHVIRYDQGNHLEIFDSLVSKYSNDPAVRIHGPVYGEEKERVLRDADVFFHLARWEVFGIVLIEAAFAGLPLILSKECDLAEEVREAGAGLVVDAEASDVRETISKFLNSKEFQEAGPKAREWAMKRYSGMAVAKLSLDLYREAMSA